MYIRVSSSQQDLERQNQIYTDAITAGYYVAGVYKEKASGARADRPELLLLLLIQ
ncbi:recombinase family protein [Vibrio fluvialis]